MPFELPPLPYDFDALEPTIDAKTMEIHHDKHHQAYVTNLNAALEGTEWADRPINQVLANFSDPGFEVPSLTPNTYQSNPPLSPWTRSSLSAGTMIWPEAAINSLRST